MQYVTREEYVIELKLLRSDINRAAKDLGSDIISMSNRIDNLIFDTINNLQEEIVRLNSKIADLERLKFKTNE